MIFNSTVASGDTGNWQNNVVVEINEKADIANTLAGYGIEDAYTKSEINNLIPEIFRNISHRLLDEPRNVMWTLSNNIMNINWNDPDDIITEEPATAIYAGTVVVKKQDFPPKNKWDGIIVDEYSNKNKYSINPLTDTITNGIYYYGIFPFDDDGIARHYRWTKTFKVDANEASPIAVINSTEVLGTTSIKVNYTLPSQNYSSIKMVYKTGGIPTSINDGVSFDLSGSSCTLSNLSVGTTYGFIIYVIDLNYRINASNSVTATTENIITYEFVNIDARRGNMYDSAGDKQPRDPHNISIVDDWIVPTTTGGDYDGVGYADYWGGAGWGDKSPSLFANCKFCVEMKLRVRKNSTYGAIPSWSATQNGTTSDFQIAPLGYYENYSYYDWNVTGRDTIDWTSSITDMGRIRCNTKNPPLMNKTGEHTVRYEFNVANNLFTGTGSVYLDGVLYDTLTIANSRMLKPIGQTRDIATHRITISDCADIQYVKVWGEV